jgi:hypothetical protein
MTHHYFAPVAERKRFPPEGRQVAKDFHLFPSGFEPALHR